MADPLKITYDFKFANGAEKKIEIALDKETLSLITEEKTTRPVWARLEYHQCGNCPLDKATHPFCPIALNLADIAQEFREITASDRAAVTVLSKERTYYKVVPIQEGLSPLLGIIMTTTGCPVMDPLKPMVRFHLPFASLEETAFRMISMFFVAQYVRSQAGKEPSWHIDGLSSIYAEVKALNKDFGQRMIAAARNDTNVHALVNLNVFAVMVPLVAETMLKEISPYFSYYLK